MAPPGMPNATSTPSASSDRTSAPAPVVGTGEATAGAGLAAAGTLAWLARWARVSGVGLVMAVPFRIGRSCTRATKKALVLEARDLAHSRHPMGRLKCAHISTRDAKHMPLTLPHLMR